MRTIIITGTSRGIGQAAAKKFLSEGWRVIGTHNKNTPAIRSVNFSTVSLDLSKSDSIESATREISTLTSSLDVLVHNAGIILDGHDTAVDANKVRQTLEVDLLGVIELTNKLLPLMSKSSHIITMNTNYGAVSTPIDDETSAGYRIAKTALNMYTRILAFNLKSRGIIVSSLDPGWVKTEMGWDVADKNYKPDREPEDVAQDLLTIVREVNISGYFWRFGKPRDW